MNLSTLKQATLLDADGHVRVFRRGFIPTPDMMPAERTHKRAKLIYNFVRAIAAYMPRAKQAAALLEIKDVNPQLCELIRGYIKQLTPEQIAFYKGPRPKYLPDGKLAIYHPQKDNPILQVVLKGERPGNTNEWGDRISKLETTKEFGGIL